MGGVTMPAAMDGAAAHDAGHVSERTTGFYARRGKRWFDLVAGGAATVVLLPLLGLVSLIVLVTSGRPVFFLQERVGRHGRIFRVIKFRSMIPNAVKHGAGYYLDERDTRITSAGRWMRLASLDELPQLFNVLHGEMSLVGPRPNLPVIVERYRPHYDHILLVKPGLTGLAAIRGRNRLQRSQMIELDHRYVRTLSLRNDLKIILATVPAVLLRKGATNVVTEEFIEDLPPAEERR